MALSSIGLMAVPSRVLMIALVALLSGCTMKPKGDASFRIWPPPPAEARIAYVGEIRSPRDVGIRTGWWRGVVNLLTGSDQGSEQLDHPVDVAIDEAGGLCILDGGSRSVMFLDSGRGTQRRLRGVNGVPFLEPVSVAKRGDILFVADAARGSVVAFDLGGNFRFETGGELTRPAGLALGPDCLWVVDAGAHTLLQYDLDGQLLQRLGGRGEQGLRFNFPTHVACAPSGLIYVTDAMNFCVKVISPDGKLLHTIGGSGTGPGFFSRPKGVAEDGNQHVFVVDALFDNVQIFDAGGQLLLHFGEAGSETGSFWMPGGIAIDDTGKIFVADTYNDRVQVFQILEPDE